MDVELLARPANAAARVRLSAGETLTAEGGSMIAMSSDTAVETHVRKKQGGGLAAGMARMLGGEGLFMNHYTAGDSGGEVYLSTSLPGDMEVIELDGSKTVNVQNGAFVAHSAGVAMDISWEGLKNIFSGENIIWLQFSGTGQVVVNAFGALYPVQVEDEYIVDTGNIAAFEDSLEFKVTKAGSWGTAIAGGEGLVCEFSGRGTVWCQTHADRNFGGRLRPLLRPKKR
jgi:uncharacterized protein (TIGR00266 family)